MKRSTFGTYIIATLFLVSCILAVGAPNIRINEALAQTPTTFTLVSNVPTVYANEFIHLTGTLSELKTGTITLYWTINATGPYTRNEALTNGVFQRDFGFSTGPGTWVLYVYWPGDATSNPATSNQITITVLPLSSPTPTPTTTPTASPTSTPTVQPTPSSTATPSPTHTFIPTPTATSSRTPTPTPTLTPTPASTLIPAATTTPTLTPGIPTSTPNLTSSASVNPTVTPISTPSPSGSPPTTQTSPSQSPAPTFAQSQTPAQQDSPSSNASTILANVWVPPPQNAIVATTVTAVAISASTVAIAAAVTPVGVPTDKATKEIRELLPSSVKKWLANYISSKQKLNLTEKTGSPFIPKKSEVIAYCISIAVLAFSFSYVKANNLAEILTVLPIILATSIIVEFAKTFVLIAYARRQGVWTEHKLWYFGLAAFIITTIAFKVPFSSPSRSVHYSPKFTKRLSAILSSAAILITLTFAGFFYFLLVSGFTAIGSTGLAMCLISAFFDTFPISPMNGKKIFGHSKTLWAALFSATLVLYSLWLILL
jgi:hypothetical protein